MDTVVELLHRGAERYGNKPYLGQKFGGEWKTTSYAEADRLSSALAAALVARGFSPGDNVAILSEGRTSWVVGEFGLLKAGCVSVPLSTKLSPEEILFRLDHSEARAILVSENNFQKAADILDRARRKPTVVCISDRSEGMSAMAAKAGLTEGKDLLYYSELLAEGEAALSGPGGNEAAARLEAIERGLSPDDTVTICYTSGTTGNPKGIMLTHRNYLHNATMAAEVVEVQEGWKSLIMLPLDHSFAHTVGIYIFLYRGLTMYFVDAQGGPLAALRNLPKNLTEVNPAFLLTVPALSGNFMKKMIQGVAEKGPLIDGIFRRGLAAANRLVAEHVPPGAITGKRRIALCLDIGIRRV